jgi:hypothetical protein
MSAAVDGAQLIATATTAIRAVAAQLLIVDIV